MILLTDDLRDRLLANGRQRDVDHVPVVKFFNPVGAGTWLITEMEPDGDTLFGLADLGFGCPELGSLQPRRVHLVRLPFDLGIERDILFVLTFRCRSMPRRQDRLAASCGRAILTPAPAAMPRSPGNPPTRKPTKPDFRPSGFAILRRSLRGRGRRLAS